MPNPKESKKMTIGKTLVNTETVSEQINCSGCDKLFDSVRVTGGIFKNLQSKFCDDCVVKDLSKMKEAIKEKLRKSKEDEIPMPYRCFLAGHLRESAKKEYERLELLATDLDLVIFGETGGGKSFLAASVALRAIDKGIRPMWTTGAAIKQSLLPATTLTDPEEKAAYRKRIERAAFLVIDDLGHGNMTPAMSSYILALLECRYPLTTIITTQYPPGAWGQALKGSSAPETLLAIARRLDDYFEQVKVKP